MLSHSYMFSSQNAIQEEEGDVETEDEDAQQQCQQPEDSRSMEPNEMDANNRMPDEDEGNNDGQSESPVVETHLISPGSHHSEEHRQESSSREDTPLDSTQSNPDDNSRSTDNNESDKNGESNQSPLATNPSGEEEQGSEDGSTDRDGEVEVFIHQALKDQAIVDNMADFEESEDEYPPIPPDPIISSSTEDKGTNQSSEPSHFQQQLRQRTVFRQARRGSMEKSPMQTHTQAINGNPDLVIQSPPFSDDYNNNNHQAQMSPSQNSSAARRGSLGFDRSPGAMVSGGALERESAGGNLARDALAAVKFDVEMSTKENADERPPSPSAEERIRKTRPLAVRLYLEGDEHLSRRINMNRVRDYDTMQFSLEKIKELAAQTFKIPTAQISLSYHTGDNETGLLLDDDDLTDALQEMASSKQSKMDISVAKAYYEPVFVRISLPQKPDTYRLVDLERILSADRQPSLTKLHKVVMERAKIPPGRSLAFAYLRNDGSRYVLANEMDFKDALQSCRQSEDLSIQSFYAGEDDYTHPMEGDTSEYGTESGDDDGRNIVSEALLQEERLSKVEMVLQKQTELLLAMQGNFRSMKEESEERYSTLTTLFDEIDERTYDDTGGIQQLKTEVAESMDAEAIAMERITDRVEKLEKLTADAIPKLEAVALGAVNATMELKQKVATTPSPKLEFVGKDRLVVLEGKVAAMYSTIETLTDDRNEMSAEEEAAAKELGDRLRRLEAHARKQRKQSSMYVSPNNGINGAAAHQNDKTQKEILERLSSLEEAMEILHDSIRPTAASVSRKDGSVGQGDTVDSAKISEPDAQIPRDIVIGAGDQQLGAE